jgi:hypothetical protein
MAPEDEHLSAVVMLSLSTIDHDANDGECFMSRRAARR